MKLIRWLGLMALALAGCDPKQPKTDPGSSAAAAHPGPVG